MGPTPSFKQQLINRYGILLTLFSVILLLPTISEAHPFHVSSMEMEWNAKTNAFEVSVQIDPNDLERELRRFSKQKIVLEDLGSDKIGSKNIVFRYVSSVFAANYNGEDLKINPIGFEVETKFVWIYFELPALKDRQAAKFNNLKITNKFLLNQHAQTNHFLLKYEKQRVSLTFHEKRTTAVFQSDDAGEKLFISIE